jgi:hypothetical protein
MALLPYQHTVIEVDVSDRIVNNTIIKQKARWLSMLAAQDALSDLLTVQVRVRVSLYANDNGEYGPPLTGKGLSTYDVTLIADNNTAVNPGTGEVRCIRNNETDEEWLTLVASHHEVLMYQGDWFAKLLNEQAVMIAPMLRDFMLQADQAPFSKYV